MIAKLLNRAKLLFKSDKHIHSNYQPVANDLLTAYNAHRTLKHPKALCHAPFMNLYFGRQGNVLVCCHNRKHIIGTYPSQSVSEIWEGEKRKELVEYLRHNDLSSGCHVCKWDLEQKQFENVKAIHFDPFPVNFDYPVVMEFELDNTCNLECTMCSGEFSSTIRKNRDGKAPIKSVYDAQFVEQLDPFIPRLTTTRFSGGEPFLIDLYFDIWSKIVALNPTCLIAVQSNGTVLNSRVKSLLEKGRFEIGISLDGLSKSTYEGIRKNANFERVLENIAYFADYCKRKNTCFRISVCAMRENWREIPLFLHFCEQYDAQLEIHNVWFPPNSSLWNLEKEMLKEIVDYLSDKIDLNQPLKKSNNLRNYQAFIQQVQTWYETNYAVEPIDDQFSGSFREQITKSIRDHILTDKSINSEAAEFKIQQLLTKVDHVFNRFNSDEKIELAAQRMLQVPIELIVSSLSFENEDRIYEQAIAFLNN